MTRQEFKQILIDATNNISVGRLPGGNFDDYLDALIASEIEAYEKAQWKPYPETTPDRSDFFVISNGKMSGRGFWTGKAFTSWTSGNKILDVKYYREYPKYPGHETE